MIFAIKPFEIHDGDGIRTTVFFKGCSLRCKWCHNPESLSAHKQIFFDQSRCVHCLKCVSVCDANKISEGKHIFVRDLCSLCGKCENVCPQNVFETIGMDMTAEEIAKEVLKDEIFMKGSGGGVTFSGGEPLLQVDLCIEIAKILKEKDINIAIDTCGAVPRSAIDQIIPYADAFLFDMKAIDENVHIACTGSSNKLILDNLKYIDSVGIPLEIRYPFVPTMNDGEVERIVDFIKELKNVKCVRVLGYHNYAQSKYDSLEMPYLLSEIVPPKKELTLVVERMKALGLENVDVY